MLGILSKIVKQSCACSFITYSQDNKSNNPTSSSHVNPPGETGSTLCLLHGNHSGIYFPAVSLKHLTYFNYLINNPIERTRGFFCELQKQNNNPPKKLNINNFIISSLTYLCQVVLLKRLQSHFHLINK